MSKFLLFAAPLEMNPAIAAGVPTGWSTACVGIGPVSSAIGTAELVAQESPSALTFLGTCGAYPGSGLAIGDIVSISSVSISSGDLHANRARLPDLEQKSRENLLVHDGLPVARAVCTLGVTEDDSLAMDLSELGEVEHLELFSICSASPLPVAALLVVSNYVGANGGKEWRANLQGVMSQLGTYVRQHVV